MAIFENIKIQEKVDFVRNLSLLIKSGNPINEAFELLAKQSRNPTFKKLLLKARVKVEQGTPIHQIFEEDDNFDNVFISFVRAGEESGTLDENLIFLGDWLERQNSLKKEMSSATLYPKIIITFSIILGGGLSIFVLPQLVKVFEGLDVDLPITTRTLLWFVALMENYGYYIFGGLFLLGILFYFLLKITEVKKVIDKIMLKIPVFGQLNQEYQLTIIAQLSAILFKSGLPVRQTLAIVGESVTNSQYTYSLNRILQKVEVGTKLSTAIEKEGELYPEIFISVVATGETSGSFGESLSYLANYFADRVTDKTKKIPVVIEPVMLIFIGILVAFIASAIVLPVYQITTGI
jgi:type IV pilus assembly protein PilC